jgi:glycosyltransferase involved in cell wall biosynthesis
MRVIHLSTSDSSGGAARAAQRLHCGLRRLGHDSTMLVLKRASLDPDVVALKPLGGIVHRMRRRHLKRRIHRDFELYAATRPAGLEAFSDDRTPYGPDLVRQLGSCDLVNFHFVAGLVDWGSLFAALPRGMPVVWRLADINAMTGGCHYDGGCGRFTAQCGACPQLGSDLDGDLSRQVWLRKRAALDRLGTDRLHIVGPSRWTASQAKASSLFRDVAVSVIPNGLDTEEFAPRDRGFSRDLWGIPRDAGVVMFAADSLVNRRKGFACLAEALKGLAGSTAKTMLLSVGSLKEPLEVPLPHRNLGRITSDRLMSLAYSAADVSVMPSLQESFGQIVSESLACGTPVIGFDTGGIPDMVRPGQTGWLVPVGDIAALRTRIVQALADATTRSAMGEQCRRIALEEYTMERQAGKYAALYECLLDRTRASGLAR